MGLHYAPGLLDPFPVTLNYGEQGVVVRALAPQYGHCSSLRVDLSTPLGVEFLSCYFLLLL